MQWDYTWDAENRLVRMTTTVAAVSNGVPNREIDFTYDYKGRRVAKRVVDLGASSELSNTRYLYDGTNLIAEFAAPGGTIGSIIRSYTWGLDILHTISNAGGVAALLQIVDHASGEAFLPTYDANGNVSTLINANTGSVAASYEYTPYGEQIRALVLDAAVASQPFRFSTQYFDVETGLYAYIRRYYDPKTGRWISRDPLEEKAGPNLYGFCGNDPVNHFDVLGEDGYGGWFSGLMNAIGSFFGFGGGDNHSNDWAGAAVQLDTFNVSASRIPGSTPNPTPSGPVDVSGLGPQPSSQPSGNGPQGPSGGGGGNGSGSTTDAANKKGDSDCSGNTGAAATNAATQNQQAGNSTAPATPQGDPAATSATPDQTQNGSPGNSMSIPPGNAVIVTLQSGSQYMPISRVKSIDQARALGLPASAVGATIPIYAPPGFDINRSMQTFSSVLQEDPTGFSSSELSLFATFAPHGPYDFKYNLGDQFDQFGNFMFGVGGAIWQYTDGELQTGAGVVHVIHTGNYDGPHGNLPSNCSDIRAGENAVNSGGQISTVAVGGGGG